MNEMHTYIILLVIFIVIGFQIYSVSTNAERISILRNIFPSLDKLRMITIYVPENQFATSNLNEILQNLHVYEDISDNDFDEAHDNTEQQYLLIHRRNKQRIIHIDDFPLYEKAGWVTDKQMVEGKTNWIEVTLVNSENHRNSVFHNIVFSLNTYLLKNRGTISDFHLIKDIVDRNTDSLDDEITSLIPNPLYLGLMGTMFGIIISVGWMTLSGDFEALFDPNPDNAGNYNAINVLLSGVGLAMISSFTGLSFTMWNSSRKYKSAKNHCEKRKNNFFTFIQTELLPVLTQNAATSINKLEKNLAGFNESFAKNNENFFGAIEKIHYSFNDHAKLIKDIKSIDLKALTIFNAKVLKEINESTIQLERFNTYISLVNDLIENTDNLNKKLNLQIDRTHTIEEAAQNLNNNTLVNKELMDFIGANFKEIKERTAMFNSAVTSADETLNKSVDELKRNITSSLDNLKKHTEESLAAVKDIQVEQHDKVKDNKNLFDNLKLLESIRNELKGLGKSLGRQENHLLAMNERLANFNGNHDKTLSKSLDFWGRSEVYLRRTFYTVGSLLALSFLVREIVSAIVEII